MDISITGAGGFIGSALVRGHLRRGDGVRVLVRDTGAPVCRLPGVRAFRGNLADGGTVPAAFLAGADVLYHCAAEVRDESMMPSVNVQGTRALTQLAAGRVGRWVQVSSAAVYGAVRAGAISEDSPLRPDSLYGRTKVESEDIARAAAADGGFELAIVRPSNVFGPAMPGRALHKLCKAVRNGRFCLVGRAGAMMNYVHVDSVVAALMLCGTRDEAAGRTFNVSDQLPIEDFIAIVAGEIGARRPALRLPEPPLRLAATILGALPGMPLTHRHLDALTCHAWYATDRLAGTLAYNPAVSLETGLREFARQWKEGAEP